MKLPEFVKKYNGKYVEYHSFDPRAKNQCVDLANQYITEVLGFPAIIGTNAQDFPSKRGDYYDWVVNTPTGLPNPGDIMIFKSLDKVGHISIFLEGNLSLFKSFDQNYPSGSPCTIVQHNYKNVLGWLRPKEAKLKSSGSMMYGKDGLEYDLNNPESMKIAVNTHIDLMKGRLVLKEEADKQINELKAEIKTLKEFKEKVADELGTENQIEKILPKVEALLGLEAQAEQVERKLELARGQHHDEMEECKRHIKALQETIDKVQDQHRQEIESLNLEHGRELEKLRNQVSELQTKVENSITHQQAVSWMTRILQKFLKEKK